MEMKPISSSVNMPNVAPKKSKLESALTFMNLASAGINAAKGISELGKTGSSGATKWFKGGSGLGGFRTPMQGTTARILGTP